MIEIIVAFIAAAAVVFPYVFQKNKELNLKIADQKRAAYESFLQNFTEVAAAVVHDEDVSTKEADIKRMSARDKLLLYASDEVIIAYDKWVRYEDERERDKAASSKADELLSLVFLAIRKDLLGKTKVTKENVTNLNPLYRG